MAAYREKTNASYKECMNTPYARMLIELADFPSIDYDNEKKQNKEKTNSKFGTPLSQLSVETLKEIK